MDRAPVPAGFADDFEIYTRAELIVRYEIKSVRAFSEIAGQMSYRAKVRRESKRKHKKLIGIEHAVKAGNAPAKPPAIHLGNRLAARDRMASLIAAQTLLNAAVPNPYAGMTPFQKDEAIAATKGIRPSVNLSPRVSHAHDTGMGMSSAAWAVGGGGA